VEGEGGDALEGDLGDDAERPEPDDGARHRRARALPGPDDGAVAADQLEPDDLRREPAEPGARAVRTRGDGAGDGLDVDVAEVLQTEAVRGELDAEVAQPGARPHPYPSTRLDGDDPGEPVQADLDVARLGHRREGVAGADGAHPPSVAGRPPDDGCDLLDAARRDDLRGGHGDG